MTQNQMNVDEFLKTGVLGLEAPALFWLLYERRAVWATFERGGFPHRPDVIGMTADKHGIEIEVKRSLSDFRADRKKRASGLDNKFIRNFFYLVPSDLVKKVTGELPDRAGLLTPCDTGHLGGFANGIKSLKCVVRSKARPDAIPWPEWRIERMRKYQSAVMFSFCQLLWNLIRYHIPDQGNDALKTHNP